MKRAKRILSLVMAFALLPPLMAPMGAKAEEVVTDTSHVVVGVETVSGSMDLTAAGTTDWIHFTHTQRNRKMVDTGAELPDIIDFMNASAAQGRTFGQPSDQVWRYQTFVPAKSGELANLEVALIKKGNPSDLIAKLYRIDGTDRTLLGTAEVPVAGIVNNTPLKLDFGNIGELTAGTTYAVAMTQKTLSGSNYYEWCESATSFKNGKITDAEGENWREENTAASLRVKIGDFPEPEPVNILSFEMSGGMVMDSTMNDSAVTYSWSDGIPTLSAAGLRTGGVLSYRDDKVGSVPDGVQWVLRVPETDNIQTLTFVSGIWNASAEINIYADGVADTPIYSNSALTAGSTANLLKYTVTVAPNTSIQVYGKLVSKAHKDGNMSIGGVALSTTEMDATLDYVALLEEAVRAGSAWLNEDISEYFIAQLTKALDSARAVTESEDPSDLEAYLEYVLLMKAIKAVEGAQASGNYANTYASGMTASFGWEGDKDAPIAWIDGTYKLRDNGNKIVTFGVTSLGAKSVSWYNAEGYLPCFVSEYEKNGMAHKVESFSDLVVIDGKKYEIAYSRMTTTNESKETKLLPRVSTDLVALNDAAANAMTVEPGKTVVRDYCIGADRFGGDYAWPADEVLAAQGSWDAHYDHMRTYWNDRLANLVDIQSIPAKYEELIDAYKAGYIYMLIISDDYELHVGENGYDRVFDHDVIGMLASLIESGHTEHFADYAQHILKNIEYPDAAWKFSWPFALYLQKTGDSATVMSFFEDVEGKAGIKTNTHKIASERVVYNANIKDVDGNPARIMKITNAIDSNGYWVIDNWAALFGLTTYSYLCDELFALTDEAKYKTESDWAKAEYDSLLKSTEAVLADTMKKYDFSYIPISMAVPNELSARSDIRDGNWGAHYLFGRWDWDGYLFGADQNSWLLERTDATYDYIIAQKSAVFDSPYNMGGYPHGFYSSSYNAGYFSAALSGEKYRDGGIEAYLWMINNSMSGLYGWWEGVAYRDETTNLWDRASSNGGGGSCQHMWGQSTATKVLLDSFLAEKADGSVIAGRGLPLEFNGDGEKIEISNWLCNAGKRIGFMMETNDKTITFTLTGDALEHDVSLELPALVDNIGSVSADCTYDAAAGTVHIPAGIKTATIEMVRDVADQIERDDARQDLERAIADSKNVDQTQYVTSTAKALKQAIEAAEAVVKNGTAAELGQAAAAIGAAVEGLVELRTYDVVFDYYTNVSFMKDPTFGQRDDQRMRYGTIRTGDAAVTFNKILVNLKKLTAPWGDVLISIHTLKADEKTLDGVIATARLKVEDVVNGGANTLAFDEPVTLEADTYYAIVFAMDNTDGVYGAYAYDSGPLADPSLFAAKIKGDGSVVDESFLGTPKVKLFRDKTDKTALDAAVEAAPAGLNPDAVAVLLDRAATQQQIDDALAAVKTEAPQQPDNGNSQPTPKAVLAQKKSQALAELDDYAAKLTEKADDAQKAVIQNVLKDYRAKITAAADVNAVETAVKEAKAALAAAAVSPDEKYTDVDKNAWYYEAVKFMITSGYMKGVSETRFDVEGTVTRDQLVTILYRMAGNPSVKDLANPFADVKGSTWYTDAVIWAANSGAVKGISDTLFAPGMTVTREQIVTILYRYSGAEKDETDHLKAFTDAGAISDYAVDAMNWAVGEGLINGVSTTTLAPQGAATRAQISAVLLRYMAD